MLVYCRASGCRSSQPWKAKGGPALRTTPCRRCGRKDLRKTPPQPRPPQRLATPAVSSPGHALLDHTAATLRVLERVAAALEDLCSMAREAGYGRGMLTGQASRPAQPAPAAQLASGTAADKVRERLRQAPRQGDTLVMGSGVRVVVLACGRHALLLAEHRQGQVREISLRREEEWEDAVLSAADVIEGEAAATWQPPRRRALDCSPDERDLASLNQAVAARAGA